MPRGTLEVLLVNAQGLKDTELLGKMDPYVIFTCRTQKQKSTVASGSGSNPEWNQTFTFQVGEGVSDLNLKIFDSDFASEDDFVGEASIPLDPVFMEGNVPPAPYNIVLRDQTYCGEIKVGLTFIPEKEEHEEISGGWKQSYF
eukprot:TRINITY_DN38183_c0_g1_i1.p1 TRINITY_DN38183_c0_g1~~TRINITY_DN38183_c0_g1_i1.p1  ORF type:complete len:143 (+),score=16.33 TRINITY_DN38183_c0_g1_i1:70-498(+)